MNLTGEKVHTILLDCLYSEGENISSAIITEGVTVKLGFHPDRIKNHQSEISELLDQLPESFKKGDSFLNACVTKEGEQWGEHADVQELMCLGQAIGRVSFLLPYQLWQWLPGGVPYFKINP